MTYFNKIEQYFAKEMSEVDCLLFEQELAENAVLQNEVAAYEMAQNLFGWTAEALTETEITASAEEQVADELIGFVAANLSEAEIMGNTSKKSAVVRSLPKRSRRTAWLAAASVALVLSFIGWNWQGNTSPATTPTLAHNDQSPEIDQSLQPETKETPTVNQLATIEKEKPFINKATIEDNPRKYEPASVKIVRKPVNNLTKNDLTNPLAINETTTGIQTERIIKGGQKVVYRAENGILLKSGFQVRTGSSFTASTVMDQTVAANVIADQKIEGAQKVTYQAKETVTLTEGFHVAAGTEFVAKTTPKPNDGIVTTNTVVSEQEEMLLQAESSITLEAGFHVRAGGNFSATIGTTK